MPPRRSPTTSTSPLSERYAAGIPRIRRWAKRPGESSACNLGIRWWDARDIRHIEVTCRNRATEATAAALKVEYWHDTWPDNPPEMPSYEDEEDDPWRGEWVQAAADATLHGNRIVYTFRPLGREELPTADRLPGTVTYRRTLKIRVTFPEQYRDEIRDIAAFAMAELQDERFRIEFLPGEKPAQRLLRPDRGFQRPAGRALRLELAVRRPEDHPRSLEHGRTVRRQRSRCAGLDGTAAAARLERRDRRHGPDQRRDLLVRPRPMWRTVPSTSRPSTPM